MACPPYVATDLKPWSTVRETTFGVTPTTALVSSGNLLNISASETEINVTLDKYGVNRTFDQAVYEATAYGFDGAFVWIDESGQPDWADVWGIYTLGSLSGITRNLPSFSAYIETAPDVHRLCNGCKVSSLQIAGQGLGKALQFTVNAMCEYIATSDTKTFTGLQNVTLGTLPAMRDSAPLFQGDDPTYWQDSAPTKVSLPAKTWNLTITTGLFGTPKNVTGADGNKYPLANGRCLASDGYEVTFTANLQASDDIWMQKKFGKVSDFNLDLPIGNRQVQLRGGAFTGGDFPTRVQGQYDETITVKFKGISIV